MKRLHAFAIAAILTAHGDVVVAESGQISGAPRPAEDTVPCVSVEVNGQRAPALACLNDRLEQAARGGARGGNKPAAGALSEQLAGLPSNQAGMFNYSATANRMGNTFGSSVNAQRPPQRPVYLPALGRRP
ncbi:hypothetical protein [Cupriavidus basilensis]|uniref:hypothetical protein n=1 Tax=Cupriavidus basilensis TaxID=68895 RepID=UPI000A8CA423|nr:hypothetical protein [Cupriavidus basilensis]